MRQVGVQPAVPSQQRHQVLLVQQGDEEQREGEEPEEHGHKEDEVDGALVLVGGDGDPQSGAEHNLQDPGDPQETPQELEDVRPHLWLGSLGWHLSPPDTLVTLVTLFILIIYPDRAGALCQLQPAGEKMNKKLKYRS